ncbi:MAG: S-layer family protein [Cyanobacteria bacterium J06555_13]
MLKGSLWQAGKQYVHNVAILPLKGIFLASILTCSAVTPALGQSIRADTTLSTTVSSSNGQNFTIDNGDRAGNNLFHSFEAFSVPTGGSAIFANPADILNIITRVSENNRSEIDGLIQANGTANLFLLNPAGIVFGPNAQLNIGGSFIGTTAESLSFDDGIEFSATAQTPLLTISTPTGLRIGTASQAIEVNDAGYQGLKQIRPLTIDSSSSLTVRPGNTLALIGNGIGLQGGTLAAPGGHIELGSVAEGLVSLPGNTSSNNTQTFDYDSVQTFAEIELSAQALLNTSDVLFDSQENRIILDPFRNIAIGSQGGSIQLQGSNITVQDGSLALTQNYTGSQTFGAIRVRASETIELAGKGPNLELDETKPPRRISSGLVTTSIGAGQGGEIELAAQRLRMAGGGQILTETFGDSVSGDITVVTTDAVDFEITGAEPESSGSISSISYRPGAAGDIGVSTRILSIADQGISSQTIGSGLGGTVRVFADQLTLTDGASIASAALGTGPGGNVWVNAADITIIGVDPRTFFPTTITAATTHSARAGNLHIETQRLRLQEGGRIDASTFATGDAGTITITADESVEISGTVPGSINPSFISSAANEIDQALRQFFEQQGIFVPPLPSGDSGNVTINTPRLSVGDGAQATVRNDGSGDAGLLTVNADVVELISNAGLTASTQEGSGGNIILDLQEVLLLRQGSFVSAEARGIGDGGNITLNAPIIIALENSDIIANAVQGTGGNIQINTQGLLGTELRDQPTPESDITASSEFGVSGSVEITNLDVAPGLGTVKLDETVADSSDQIVAGCANTQASQFIATGRGGIPISPRSATGIASLWTDVRSPFTEGIDTRPQVTFEATHTARSQPQPASLASANQLTEATAWRSDQHGEVSLIAPTEEALPADTTTSTCLSDTIG